MARGDDIVTIYIVQEQVSSSDKFSLFVGTKWRRQSWDNSGEIVWHGSATAIPVRFDTLPRARSAAKALRDIYKAMGRRVQCNLRPRRG